MRQRIERTRKKALQLNRKEGAVSGWMGAVRGYAILTGVALFAAVFGYQIGFYAIRLVTGPLIAPEGPQASLSRPSGASPGEIGGGGPATAAGRTPARQAADDPPQRSAASVFRVQVGPFGDAAAADAAVARLRAEGYPDSFKVLSPTYRVQVGAFSSEEKADELAARLRARGYAATVVK